MVTVGKIVFAKFTTVWSIYHCCYNWKVKDDKQKKFIPQLAIDTKFFHRAFANPCKTKGAVGEVCTLLHNWQLGAIELV
jgi:hypothetical protein